MHNIKQHLDFTAYKNEREKWLYFSSFWIRVIWCLNKKDMGDIYCLFFLIVGRLFLAYWLLGELSQISVLDDDIAINTHFLLSRNNELYLWSKVTYKILRYRWNKCMFCLNWLIYFANVANFLLYYFFFQKYWILYTK